NSTQHNKSISLGPDFIINKKDWIDLDSDSSLSIAGFNWLRQQNIYDQLKEIVKSGNLCIYIDEAAVSLSKNLLEERDFSDKEIVKLKGQLSDPKIVNTLTLGLSDYTSEILWASILAEIDNYDNELKQFAAALVSKNSFSENRLISQISQWQKDHPNPRADLAENCLNGILGAFYLEVDVDGTESRIVLKTKKGSHIPGRYLSTGTKQLLTTSIPLYKANVKEGVVLFDEPERSLFPDIQRELIKHYTSLAGEAQFFFATHSPIIASAFEPCERFILYFDENGEVKFHNGVAPEGDDPNDVLRQDFGMADLMLQKGLEAYEEYRQLAMQIRSETDEEKKNQLIAQRLELGNRYNFAGQYAQSK
ncbi:ATP-binding protein, partial [Nostoc sp. CHAB 5834]|nr:ATP-binding protein [Nostoc sp. CHAB 5834]